MTGDPAADWLAANHPDQPPLPTDDTGRNHHDVQLAEPPYVEPPPTDRPGTRRNPAWMQREAIDSQAEEIAGRARAAEGMCERCRRRPVKYARLLLCDACNRARLRRVARQGQ